MKSLCIGGSHSGSPCWGNRDLQYGAQPCRSRKAFFSSSCNTESLLSSSCRTLHTPLELMNLYGANCCAQAWQKEKVVIARWLCLLHTCSIGDVESHECNWTESLGYTLLHYFECGLFRETPFFQHLPGLYTVHKHFMFSHWILVFFSHTCLGGAWLTEAS